MQTELTLRQIEVGKLLQGGLSTREIARKLGLTKDTIIRHIQALGDKLDVVESGPKRREAVLRKFAKAGYVIQKRAA